MILVFLAKPLLYFVALLLGARWLAPASPGRWPRWLVVSVATVVRLVLGLVTGFLAIAASANDNDFSLFRLAIVLYAAGFLIWLAVAKVTFRGAALSRLVVFSGLVEVVGCTIDVLTWNTMQNVHTSFI